MWQVEMELVEITVRGGKKYKFLREEKIISDV